MRRLVLALVVFLQCSLAPCLASIQATDSPIAGSITANDSAKEEFFAIDQKILLEEINLARFNIHFHQKANEHWWLRGWLYPIAQESGTSLSLSNSIIDISERADGLNNPARVSVTALKHGLACAITGNAINGSSSCVELAQNAWVILKANRQGFSPRESVAIVKAHLEIIDNLLAERSHLIVASTLNSEERLIRAIEEHLMERTRDELVFEFRKWSTYSREFMWQENTFYIIDALQNFTQMSSSILSLEGFRNPPFKGGAGITSIVASSVTAINPTLSAITAHIMRAHQRAYLAKALPFRYIDPSTESTIDWSGAKELIANAPQQESLKEVSLLINNEARFDFALAKEKKEINKLRQVADQQAIAAPIIGTMSIAQAICTTIAYYGYRGSPITSNRLNFAGRISRATGQSYGLMATASARIRKTFYDRRLAKQGKLPEQILAQRLINLDKLEIRVKELRP